MYYPKAKILENLFTNGGELIDPTTGQFYSGAYHATYDGNYFTQATHSIDSKILTLNNSSNPGSVPTNEPTGSLTQLVIAQSLDNIEYSSINSAVFNSLSNQKIPDPFYPVITTQDLAAGSITRYFMKRGSKITEISSDGFTTVATNVLYQTTMIPWKIVGPYFDEAGNPGVYSTNQRIVQSANKTFPGISSYLTDFIQFAVIDKK